MQSSQIVNIETFEDNQFKVIEQKFSQNFINQNGQLIGKLKQFFSDFKSNSNQIDPSLIFRNFKIYLKSLQNSQIQKIEDLNFEDFDIDDDKNLMSEQEQETWGLIQKYEEFLKEEIEILESLSIVFSFIEDEKKKLKKILISELQNVGSFHKNQMLTNHLFLQNNSQALAEQNPFHFISPNNEEFYFDTSLKSEIPFISYVTVLVSKTLDYLNSYLSDNNISIFEKETIVTNYCLHAQQILFSYVKKVSAIEDFCQSEPILGRLTKDLKSQLKKNVNVQKIQFYLKNIIKQEFKEDNHEAKKNKKSKKNLKELKNEFSDSNKEIKGKNEFSQQSEFLKPLKKNHKNFEKNKLKNNFKGDYSDSASTSKVNTSKKSQKNQKQSKK